MPLVKDKGKTLDDVNNYRPIAIVPIFAKIFESCISVYLCEFLNTHNNQLGALLVVVVVVVQFVH